MSIRAATLSLGLAMALATPSRADLAFACEVERVVDGDTWRCKDMHAAVRMFGVDAPDWHCRGRKHCTEDRPAAERAKGYLTQLIHGRTLQCEGKDTDRWGRVVARCTLDGQDLGCAMIRAGHGLEMPRFSKGAYRGCRP